MPLQTSAAALCWTASSVLWSTLAYPPGTEEVRTMQSGWRWTFTGALIVEVLSETGVPTVKEFTGSGVISGVDWWMSIMTYSTIWRARASLILTMKCTSGLPITITCQGSTEMWETLNQWNNHGLRTERHMSPLQIFVRDFLEHRGRPSTAMQDIFGAIAGLTGVTSSTVAAGAPGTEELGLLVDMPERINVSCSIILKVL